ncbi:MAG: cation transporter [Prevotella sp.]|nr:cation transporter [Prevotella sp.]
MAKNVFAVSGMKCEHCKANVENALKAVNGVREAEVSLADANVKVEYDEAVVTPVQLKEAVDNSGRYEMSL